MKNFIRDTEVAVLIFSVLITFGILLFFLAKTEPVPAFAETGMIVYLDGNEP